MRIGLGYDAHVFAEGRKLYLGGVRIPDTPGLAGHSDADVLLHAICDALLGAAGESDIGAHFPDSDQSAEGIESAKILARVVDLVDKRGFAIVNIDAVVVCEAPKILPYRARIKEAIAGILGIGPDRVNVKGKTTEGMGFTGRREGIACYAVCLLE
jgi:2-C-methyl-D-erythritol 2,4-cyclodiphosphate synthase